MDFSLGVSRCGAQRALVPCWLLVVGGVVVVGAVAVIVVIVAVAILYFILGYQREKEKNKIFF